MQSMTTVAIEVPDNTFVSLGRSPEEFARDLRVAGAILWYGQGVISQDQAASIAGLDRTDFLLALARARVEAFQVTAGELKGEVELALQARRGRLAAHLPDEGGAPRGAP